jgi:hypothetical protein
MSLSPPRAQEQVTLQDVKVRDKQGASWAEVPGSIRGQPIPARPIPTDQERWQEVERGA